jgi:hypothetical protein
MHWLLYSLVLGPVKLSAVIMSKSIIHNETFATKIGCSMFLALVLHALVTILPGPRACKVVSSDYVEKYYP